MITHQELLEKFKYCSETGMLYRKKRNGEFALCGHISATGYLRISFNNKIYPVHRLIWMYVHGEMPKGDIDHINHTRNDNRISNLRTVTRQGNSRNRSANSNNKSGFTGVCFHKRLKKWQVSITIDQKQIHVGYFTGKNEAVSARKTAEKQYGFHQNHGQ